MNEYLISDDINAYKESEIQEIVKTHIISSKCGNRKNSKSPGTGNYFSSTGKIVKTQSPRVQGRFRKNSNSPVPGATGWR